jgi:DNA-binding transcriptional ArsR family regulator
METKDTLKALAALAQESRLAIFRLLVEQGRDGLPVGKIGEHFGIAPATLSFHLKELTNADLITARQQGRFINYSANFVTMTGLVGFLTENCCDGDLSQCIPACESPHQTTPGESLERRKPMRRSSN